MHIPLLLVSSLFLQIVAAAQSASLNAEINRANQLLHSASLPEKAWGVHIASGLHSSLLEAQLLDELRAVESYRNAPGYGPEAAYVQSLLDGLIQLRSIVPVEALRPFNVTGHDLCLRDSHVVSR